MKNTRAKFINVHTLTSLGITVATLTVLTQLTYAQFIDDAQQGISDIDNGGSIGTVPEILKSIVNLLLFLVGIVSVIMLIIGGIRFVVSSGDSQAAANARNTILYSVIGIIVAVAAYGIVSWVLSRLYGTSVPAPTGGG